MAWHLSRGIVVQLVRAPPCHGGSCEFESRQSRLNDNKPLIIILTILLLKVCYSPCIFSSAKPNERPSKVIKNDVLAALIISALANGKIFNINSIIVKIFKFYKVFRFKNHFEPKQLKLMKM